MEYWFKKKSQELDLAVWKTVNSFQMGTGGAK